MKPGPTIAFHIELDRKGRKWYVLDKSLPYYSQRYKRAVTVQCGYRSDGASGPARDIASAAWWVHDWLCEFEVWDDGTPTTALQRSYVLHDILKSEGNHFAAVTWGTVTYWYEIITRKRK